ncbi:hypothetical protein GWI33_006851 [Rhynchophorus ferrugineus]|uniref:RNA helicase n=1 Tax=Rhynchophorus ferrugineus TaxID=354439 RepID=A0A834MF60_RHYFE|nr:hypothetical protein GWI33_006851 [Rhynchophorus ferrugineus]
MLPNICLFYYCLLLILPHLTKAGLGCRPNSTVLYRPNTSYTSGAVENIMKHKRSKTQRCLSLTDVIKKVNATLPKDEHVNAEKLKNSFGEMKDISNELMELLRCEFNRSIVIEKSFTQNKGIWLCNLNFGDCMKKSFEGIGITKQTAEYNSSLAAVLWLKKVSTNRELLKNNYSICLDNDSLNKEEQVLDPLKNQKKLKHKKNKHKNSMATLSNSEMFQNLFNIVKKKSNKFSVQNRLIYTSSSLSARKANFEKNVENSLPLISNTKVEENCSNEGNLQQYSDQNNNICDEHVNTISRKHPTEYKNITLGSYSEVQHIHAKYPEPKNVLHAFYQVLQNQLHNKSLNWDVSYKSVRTGGSSEWMCVYHLKWPEHVKISAREKTKKQASMLAALKCLAYLSECGKLSNDGMPLIYTKDEVKTITQKKEKEITIDRDSLAKMERIRQIFDTNIQPLIKDFDYSYETESINIEDPEKMYLKSQPKYLQISKYVTKEKTHLPISDLKEAFMDLLNKNKCVIVKGQPGCGKSTRIPQYVLESWAWQNEGRNKLCRIAVTEPRRIAAISLAERVADERDESVGPIVGYQVRLKSNFQPRTGRILYCTTGILLRHLQTDPKLTNFSHVILDEAHERDLNTDLLMNQLKRAMKENENLKVLVMSATIDAGEFSKYFDDAPIFEVPGFTYPVKQHYLDHCKLDVSKTLRMCAGDHPQVVHEDVAKVVEYIHKVKDDGAILVFLPGWEDLSRIQRLLSHLSDAVVCMLHSKLKDSEQYKIFSRPPPSMRKIILATNIAETSITIDDVVYVIDTGLHKDQIFDNDKGISVIDMEWISKASANQRAGRAGRCAPGEAYHLYSLDKYNSFDEYTTPKIINSSLTKVVLDSKTLVNNMSACEFMNNLITPPERQAVERAVEELKQLELLNDDEELTPLGRTLVNFQLEPDLAKTMVNSVVFKCTTPIVDIITLFSAESEIFGSLSLTSKESIKTMKEGFSKNSDHLALMRIYEQWLELFEEDSRHEAYRFCNETNLVPHRMEYISKLKDIHIGYLYNGLYDSLPICDDYSDNDELVKAVLYSGTGNLLVHRNWDMVKNRLKTNVNVLVTRNNHKATITPDSVNYRRNKFPSDFLVYMNETRSNIRRTSIVRECSLIPAVSVLLFCNKELLVKPVPKELDQDLVNVSIDNTNLTFLMNKDEAGVLVDCKSAIESSYKYLIHQLVYSGEDISEMLGHWNKILKNLDSILTNHKIK